ncbi:MULTISPECIES: glutaredoxin [unclassified Francisella]|uniref:glutaredoxin n=1 Tax=unclassified Francisella TaxID=2610885 RepID=UPI002E30DF34|nr:MULTISPECIES: glutaredoxin [unclassified Francisella]MED7818834.1 glutaredoxin [Francisella sp. 19S2-4]MED7829711.1 glutaredoxin [Francisella sp. 19S2-10]
MKVKIYTRNGCPFCVWAKQWFDDNGINFDEITIDDYAQRANFYDEMNQSGKVSYHISTVPQIFVDDEHIGGFTELKANADKILSKK